MQSYLPLDVDAPELGGPEVLEDQSSLADHDSDIVTRALDQMLATTLADEVKALPQSSVGVRLVGVVGAVERQLRREELQADVWLVSVTRSAV